MKVTIAAFKTMHGSHLFFNFTPADPTLVQTTEFLEVELPDLDKGEVLANQIALLDAQAEMVKTEYFDTMSRIETRKQELMSLPAPEAACRPSWNTAS